jgi:hypothetical protein
MSASTLRSMALLRLIGLIPKTICISLYQIHSHKSDHVKIFLSSTRLSFFCSIRQLKSKEKLDLLIGGAIIKMYLRGVKDRDILARRKRLIITAHWAKTKR